MELKDLLEKIKDYDENDINEIKKAYEYAKYLHNGQLRQSGEPYIIHPLHVAYILAEMHADKDTICAGLLHDTLEDTNITKDDIAHDFNPNVASLVDGVTKISKLNFSSKQEQNYANTRKIITSLTSDIRIIIIKLADRLHNMRTLQYKSEFKQKENALETMEIFVPLASYIGAYRIKSELEDLSLQYLKPDMYKKISDKRKIVEKENNEMLKEMNTNINKILNDNNIPNEIKTRTKNVYGIYKRLNEGEKIYDIHDLLALKVIVDTKLNCYNTLGLIHELYNPYDEKFKDYICKPKANLYRSLHTTVFSNNDRLVQNQIRTFDMDKIASFGFTAYWDIEKGNARDRMQKELKEKSVIFKSIVEMDKSYKDNHEFVSQVKRELFEDNIYIYTNRGDMVVLPHDSTPIDLAYKLKSDIGNTMIGAIVNDNLVGVDYVLHDKDRVKILCDDLSFGPREEWMDIAQTTLARRKIKEFNKGTNFN